MKIFFPTFLLIILALAIYPFIDDDDAPKKLTGLPWQIESLPGGETRVFGIVPGNSTLAQAAKALGDDYELALVAKADSLSLEMYYSHYRAGLLSGKLVIAAKTSDEALESLRQSAVKTEYMGDGKAKKLLLNEAGRQRALQQLVDVMAFIPAVNLDDEIIRQRFGEPAELLRQQDGVAHYLYPEKGLDIALSDSEKEVLQYIAPAEFARLRQPLAQQQPTPEN